MSNYNALAVWGAGGLGQTALKRWLPRSKVRALIDSNPSSATRTIENFKPILPDNFDFGSVEAVIVCASAFVEVERALRDRKFAGHIHYVYELFLSEHEGHAVSEIDSLRIDLAATKNANWLYFVLSKPQILVNITFRIGNWLAQRALLTPLYWLVFLIHQTTCLLTSIQLPLGTPIGPGLVFAHYGTIVFTRRARIGAFFTIYHGCTIGTNDSGQGPVVGNFVYQYAGSHILGLSVIGSRSRIGANAVVLDQSCPPESTLVGIPARVVIPRARA